MKIKKYFTKTTLAGGLLALAIAGCGPSPNRNVANKNLETVAQTETQQTQQFRKIEGLPLSAVLKSSYNGGDWVYAVVRDANGKNILAYAGGGGSGRAAALIQSEISDGDKETIEIIGKPDYPDPNEFAIYRLKANGLTIDFKD